MYNILDINGRYRDFVGLLSSITATYLVGAAVSAALYYLIGSGGNLVRECGKLNWTSLVPGFVIVGLEVGKFENKLCAFAEIKEATQKTGHTRA